MLDYKKEFSNTKSGQTMFDMAVIGHFTIDQIIVRDIRPKTMLGGSSTYVSLAAKRMGAKVAVVSKVGNDFPDEYLVWLSRNGINLAALSRVDKPTTRFILKYENEARTLQLKSRCAPILPSDIPSSLKSKCIHIGSVAGEISDDTVHAVAEKASLISLDPQGFIRRFDREGYAENKARLSREMLKHINVLKSSEEELKAAMGIDDAWKAAETAAQYGPDIVIMTKGARGALMLCESVHYEVPACKPNLFVDPTGAGDAFIGAFMAEYVQGEDPLLCAAIGSAASSFIVEGIGPSSFGSRDEVLIRARQAFEQIKKL